MKQKNCADNKARKEISFGVNDLKEKRKLDKEKFKAGRYMELKSITFLFFVKNVGTGYNTDRKRDKT